MNLIERLQMLYRNDEISGDELQCLIASVMLHANLPNATIEYGTIAYDTAKKLERIITYKD